MRLSVVWSGPLGASLWWRATELCSGPIWTAWGGKWPCCQVEGRDTSRLMEVERTHTHACWISLGSYISSLTSHRLSPSSGYVGAGMLSAAVAGGVFASPPPASILAAILSLHNAGNLFLFLLPFNFTELERSSFSRSLWRPSHCEELHRWPPQLRTGCRAGP